MHNVNAAGMSKSTAPGFAIQLANVITEYGAALVDKQMQEVTSVYHPDIYERILAHNNYIDRVKHANELETLIDKLLEEIDEALKPEVTRIIDNAKTH